MRRPLLLAAVLLLGPVPAAPAADLAATKRALGREMARVSAQSGAFVRDLETDATLYARRSTVPRIPASVQKLVTTSTALRRLGPQATLRTTVLTDAALDADGVLDGDLVLRGGGDPTLSRSRLAALARTLRDELGLTRVRGSVLGDGTAFDALRGSRRTRGAYDPDMGGVLGALTVGAGFSRAGRSPEAEAAVALARALRAAGVTVSGRSGAGVAPAGARELAALESAPLATLAALVNGPSNNFMSEVLLKAVAARDGAQGTTARGAQAARNEARTLGATVRPADGSGLSRANRIAPREAVDLLDGMEEDPVAGPAFLASLAVAGRSGTLVRRMRGTSAAGRCRAKTGTIRGVSTLAGYCTSRDEGLLAFAFLMNGTSTWAAHRAQDRMAAVLARYDG